MPAGELRERVRFERRVKAGDDGFGNVTYAWQAITGTVGANLEPQGSSETVDQELLRADASFGVTVRWSKQTQAIVTNDRMINARTGEVYDIRSIGNPDQRRRYLVMTVVKSGAEA